MDQIFKKVIGYSALTLKLKERTNSFMSFNLNLLIE